jgi:uncharacterized Zn-binding protein involved in type VI secretion
MAKGPGANVNSIFNNNNLQGAVLKADSVGSLDVKYEKSAALRMGDPLPSDAVLTASTTVRVNGQFASRMTDSTASGGTLLTGAFTVMIGG